MVRPRLSSEGTLLSLCGLSNSKEHSCRPKWPTWGGMNALSSSRGHKEIEEYLRSKGAVEPWRALGDKLESPGKDILWYVKKQLGKVQELSLQAIVPSEPNI